MTTQLEQLSNAAGALHQSCDFLMKNFEIKQQVGLCLTVPCGRQFRENYRFIVYLLTSDCVPGRPASMGKIFACQWLGHLSPRPPSLSSKR
eukprot:2632847-Amphidinium_carterae.1